MYATLNFGDLLIIFIMALIEGIILFSSPLIAICSVVYFVKNINNKELNFYISSTSLIIANFTAIIFTKIGIFLYGIYSVLSNSDTSEKWDNFQGLKHLLETSSYILPFIVVIIFFILITYENKKELKNKLEVK